MEEQRSRFHCAHLPEQAVEAVRQYEADLKRMMGKDLILIAYEEEKAD